VKPGELVAVMGPNGMGKTTLISLMAGVLCPIKGKIEINGRPRRHSVEEEIEIRKKVVFLPDNPYLPLRSTGREFLLATGMLYEVESFRLMEHIERLLPLFDLEEIADSPIRTYSAGQKKKIGLCSALVTEAPVMILDEPFSGIDPITVFEAQEVIRELKQRGLGILLTDHNVRDTLEITHRSYIINLGEIVVAGPKDELLESEVARRIYLGEEFRM